MVFAAAGALFIVSAANSQGVDLRPSGATDLAGLVRTESAHVEELQGRAAGLRGQIDRLSQAVNDQVVKQAQAAAASLRAPAGFTEVTGAGVEVVLEDAPAELREDTELDLNLLVVHQQDIQAVVNAMWQAGAKAITIQGQRIISTTGIKCVGNSVELHGIPYSQPFVIRGVGDPERIERSIDSSDYLAVYRSQAADPDIAIGWEMDELESFTAPAYAGSTSLEYAVPME